MTRQGGFSTRTHSTRAASGPAVAADAAAFDAARRDDAAFNEQFRHSSRTSTASGCTTSPPSTVPPLVLLAGWPQSWLAWRDILPAFAEQHTVYAVDLPGLGDSQGSPSGYDKATLARYVHSLVADELGLDEIALAGHDLGAGVAFQYASQFPQEVSRYAHLDYPLPGPALSVLSGGFELYCTLDVDERDNAAAAPVGAPTLLMTAEGTLASTRPTLDPLLSNLVRGPSRCPGPATG